MAISLYTISVPVFVRYLTQLLAILDKAERHLPSDQDSPAAVLLHAQLAAGMFRLDQQIRTAADFSLRACCPLAQIDPPAFSNDEKSFGELRQRLEDTIAFLQALPQQRINQAQERSITTQAGFAMREFSASDYLLHYALPNFFFHLTTAYAILRSNGIPLSKGDFDGVHYYTEGFAFPDPADSVAAE